MALDPAQALARTGQRRRRRERRYERKFAAGLLSLEGPPRTGAGEYPIQQVTDGDNRKMQDYILEARGLTKDFNGFRAVDDVNLQIRSGDIHALIGPNGAGKSTCFNLLTKFLKPTAGEIRYKGRDITADSPAGIARQGLVRSFQISAVFPHLTVLENVRVGLQRRLGTSFHFWKSGDSLNHLDRRAGELLDEVGLAAFGATLAGDLSYGRKRALEIAVTLAMDPEVMLLDEPTQGMGHEDIDRVAALIKKVSSGRTVLMVEHNMSVVSGICDRISVLQRGRLLAEGSYREISENPQVREAYMGTASHDSMTEEA
jgi:branched-chain amino acid transport system ATP-binding protein